MGPMGQPLKKTTTLKLNSTKRNHNSTSKKSKHFMKRTLCMPNWDLCFPIRWLPIDLDFKCCYGCLVMSSVCLPRAFHSKLKSHLFKLSFPDSPDSISSHSSPILPPP